MKRPAPAGVNTLVFLGFSWPEACNFMAGDAVACVPEERARTARSGVVVSGRELGVRDGCRLRRDEGSRRRRAPGLWRAVALARGSAARRARLPAARGRASVPPHRHHLRGLWRSRRAGTADPLRRHPAHHVRRRMAAAGKGPHPARQGAQCCSSRTSTARARSCAPAWCPTIWCSAIRRSARR